MSINKLFLLTIAFLFILSPDINSQSSFLKGYIITIKGDTLSGELLYQNSRKASKQCIFRKSENDSVRKFTPGEISGYIYNNYKYYISKNINTETNPGFVFLELLLKGKASIYYLCDNTGDHYFMDNDGINLVEISEQQRQIYTDSGIKEIPSNFKPKLEFILSDCNEIKPLINVTQLNYKSLVDLTKRYNSIVCPSQECIVYERSFSPITITYSLLAGYSLKRFNFGNQLISNLGSSAQIGMMFTFKNIFLSNEGININAGLFFERDTKYELSNFQKNSQEAELVYYNDKIFYIYPFAIYGTVPDLKVDFDFWSVNVPLILTYSICKGKAIFSFGGGVSNRITLKQSNNFRYLEFYSLYGKTFNPYFIGAIGEIGFNYKLKSGHAFIIKLSEDYSIDPGAVNQFLRLRINQFSINFGYSL